MENSDEKIKLIGMNDLSYIRYNASLRNYDTETDKQAIRKNYIQNFVNMHWV